MHKKEEEHSHSYLYAQEDDDDTQDKSLMDSQQAAEKTPSTGVGTPKMNQTLGGGVTSPGSQTMPVYLADPA